MAGAEMCGGSRPEGLAAPFTLKAAARMTSVSRDSNIMGWGSCGSFEIIHELYTGWPMGCLLISDSLTVGKFGSSGLTGLRWRIPPFSSLDKEVKGSLTLPHEHQVGE